MSAVTLLQADVLDGVVAHVEGTRPQLITRTFDVSVDEWGPDTLIAAMAAPFIPPAWQQHPRFPQMFVIGHHAVARGPNAIRVTVDYVHTSLIELPDATLRAAVAERLTISEARQRFLNRLRVPGGTVAQEN